MPLEHQNVPKMAKICPVPKGPGPFLMILGLKLAILGVPCGGRLGWPGCPLARTGTGS